jgi:hypothetical protein
MIQSVTPLLSLLSSVRTTTSGKTKMQGANAQVVHEGRLKAGLKGVPPCLGKDETSVHRMPADKLRGSYRILSRTSERGPQNYKGLDGPSSERDRGPKGPQNPQGFPSRSLLEKSHSLHWPKTTVNATIVRQSAIPSMSTSRLLTQPLLQPN